MKQLYYRLITFLLTTPDWIISFGATLLVLIIIFLTIKSYFADSKKSKIA